MKATLRGAAGREPLARDLEARGGVAGGVESVVPYLDVAGRQYMLNEAREELLAGQGGGFAVPGPERHPVLVHGEKALVGEPDAMRVPTEVADHLLGTAEGSLRVDDPAHSVKRLEIDAAKIELPSAVRAVERGEHLSAEEGAHHSNGEEEVAARAHPALRVVGETAAGNDGVHVRVKAEVARPCVQHHRDAELGAETLGVLGEREERLRGGGKEQVEDGLPVTARHRAQLGGQREDDVEVRHGKQALEPLVDPSRLRERLALGAVPIPARVIRRSVVPAGAAHVEMAAEDGGPTSLDGAQDGVLVVTQRACPSKGLPVSANDIRELEPAMGWRAHARAWSGHVPSATSEGVERVERARDGLHPCGADVQVRHRAP